MDTQPRILVTYATAAGSTSGVAERIAGTLQAAGADVACRPAGPDADLRSFGAFVVGSAVHNMAWLQPALDLLVRVDETGRPVWCFSVGGIQPRGRVTRAMTDRELQRIAQSFPRSLALRDHRMFGGIIDMRHTPLWGRLFFRATGGRPGDHRDWASIQAWGERIAADLPVGRDSVATPTAPAGREGGRAPGSGT
jgi:menaquinone-dependent protoporphyrinogen oxidase